VVVDIVTSTIAEIFGAEGGAIIFSSFTSARHTEGGVTIFSNFTSMRGKRDSGGEIRGAGSMVW